ncbi:MAG: transglutaminase-like domain-containing protein, partial [Flavobacteriales bacterium]
PALSSGSIAHVAYTLSFPDARFASSHFFGDSYPTEESSLTVICDEGIEVDVKLFNVPDSMLIRSTGKEKGRNVQRFAMRRIPAVRFESNAPSFYYYVPHAQLVVNVPGTAEAGDATSRLYQWYTEHVEQAFADIPEPLRLLSDSITAGLSDPRDKAAHLFRWVQDKVQYVAIEDGMNGFIPANAMDVCRARYGDCKGMSNLLRTLLQSAGLDAHLAWVGTTQLPYTYAELPTSANSNHMIVALDMADTTLFLDPTSRHSAFGVPSGFIQGKEALIGMDKERHRVQRIPVMPASYSTVHDSVRGRLTESTFNGQGVVRFTGYKRHRITDALRDNTPEKRLQVMRQVLMKGSNAFLLDSIDVQGLDDREGPLTVSYRFRIPDLARQVGSKSYMPLTLSDPWKALRVFEDRKLPIHLEYCSIEHYSVTLELPPGATCSGIPDTFDSGTENFNIRIDHTLQPSTITSEARFTTNELMIRSDMDAWRKLNTAYLKERGRTLVIETP